MQNVLRFTALAALLSSGWALPSYCADVGLLPAIGAGSRLGMTTYDSALPGPGLSLELRGDRRDDAKRSDDTWPDDPALTGTIDRRAVVFGLGLSRSFAIAIGARQIQETIELPAVFDEEGEQVSPKRKVKGPKRSNVFYSASLGLLRTAPLRLGLSVFGSAYHKQKPKLSAGLTELIGYQPSYSLPLKPHYGAMLHSAVAVIPTLTFYLNGGDRYHNNEELGVFNLRHEPIVQSQIAWRPLAMVELMAGYEARWLQMYSKKSRGGDGSTIWRHDAAVSYGAAVNVAGFWLEGYGRHHLAPDQPWAATRTILGAAIGYRFAAKRSRQVSSRPTPRAVPRPAVRQSNKAVPQPAVIGDIREAERIAAKARRDRAIQAQRQAEQEQRRIAAERKARLKRLEQSEQEQFPEIDNLPDVTDQEYFWNGLED